MSKWRWVQHHAEMSKKEIIDAATVGRKLEGRRKYISMGSSTMLAATRWV